MAGALFAGQLLQPLGDKTMAGSRHKEAATVSDHEMAEPIYCLYKQSFKKEPPGEQ